MTTEATSHPDSVRSFLTLTMQRAFDLFSRQVDDEGKMIKAMKYSEHNSGKLVHNPVGCLVVALDMPSGEPKDLLDPRQVSTFESAIKLMATTYLTQFQGKTPNFENRALVKKLKESFCEQYGVPCETDADLYVQIVNFLSRQWSAAASYDCFNNALNQSDFI